MANEYLQRTPTSTGNRRVWTWAGWIKRNSFSTFQSVFSAANSNNVNETFLYYIDGYIRLFQSTGDGSGSAVWSTTNDGQMRDPSAMLHIVISVDTTQTQSSDRVQIYINGVNKEISGATYPSINYEAFVNATVSHRISGRPSGIQNFGGQLSDVFLVDGQALTPDVFGFYKQGKGYISVGSTQATDFRPGQWVPKTPRVIKTEINRRGGFGVNGFYLPMNDSRNFGADFHCDPNSIITLNEKLPQPRVGVASTAVGIGYTDVLRADPYAANLVLALPFVSGGLQSGFGDYAPSIKGSGSAKTITTSSVSIANTASYYGSAMYAIGPNNYAAATSSSDFNFGTGDFTVECWIYLLSLGAGSYNHYLSINDQNTFAFKSDSTFYYLYANSALAVKTSNVPKLNQWTHLALVRKGTILTIFENGVAAGITTNYTSSLGATAEARIGSSSNTTNEGLNGYIEDLRVYKGVAKYKGGFDVPRPYTPVGIATWRAVPDCTANNFATLNALTQLDNNNITYTNGNLTGYVAANTNSTVSTIGISSLSSRKYYAEFRATSSSYPRIGVIDATVAQQGISASGSGSASANNLNTSGAISWGGTVNELYINSGTGIVNSGYTTGDIIGVAYDSSTRNVWFSKNGTWQNFTGSGADPATGINPVGAVNGSDSVYFGIRPENSNIDCNFGQNPTFSGNITAGTFTDTSGKGVFKYQPPSGFLALCEDNLPTPAISDPGKYFRSVLYTGDGNATRSITGIGFTPDLVWVKDRSVAYNHLLIDSVRGATFNLHSNNTDTEGTATTNGVTYGTVTSFGDNSISLSKGSTGAWTNQSGENYVAWCWRAGAGTTSTNTNGSITSVVSVNQDAGFSVVSYTASGTTSTIGHGLGKVPKFIIAKSRTSAGYGWTNYHTSLGKDAYVMLYSTDASASSSNYWGTSLPSTTVFGVAPSAFNNNSGNMIAYCWAEIEGFSKFGSYSGNNSTDGPFVFTNGRPAFVMIKRTDSAGQWNILDSSRSSTNPAQLNLLANTSDVETDGSRVVDFLSNGFKIRTTSGDLNASGGTYIYACFMESPFTTANSK